MRILTLYFVQIVHVFAEKFVVPHYNIVSGHIVIDALDIHMNRDTEAKRKNYDHRDEYGRNIKQANMQSHVWHDYKYE